MAQTGRRRGQQPRAPCLRGVGLDGVGRRWFGRFDNGRFLDRWLHLEFGDGLDASVDVLAFDELRGDQIREKPAHVTYRALHRTSKGRVGWDVAHLCKRLDPCEQVKRPPRDAPGLCSLKRLGQRLRLSASLMARAGGRERLGGLLLPCWLKLKA